MLPAATTTMICKVEKFCVLEGGRGDTIPAYTRGTDVTEYRVKGTDIGVVIDIPPGNEPQHTRTSVTGDMVVLFWASEGIRWSGDQTPNRSEVLRG